MIDLIDNLVFKVALQRALDRLVLAVPLLGNPILGAILYWASAQVLKLVVPVLEQFVAFTIIDSEVGGKRDRYSETVDALRAAQAKGDKDATAKASDAFDRALDELGHSARPKRVQTPAVKSGR